jgi:hypothetical protein
MAMTTKNATKKEKNLEKPSKTWNPPPLPHITLPVMPK